MQEHESESTFVSSVPSDPHGYSQWREGEVWSEIPELVLEKHFFLSLILRHSREFISKDKGSCSLHLVTGNDLSAELGKRGIRIRTHSVIPGGLFVKSIDGFAGLYLGKQLCHLLILFLLLQFGTVIFDRSFITGNGTQAQNHSQQR